MVNLNNIYAKLFANKQQTLNGVINNLSITPKNNEIHYNNKLLSENEINQLTQIVSYNKIITPKYFKETFFKNTQFLKNNFILSDPSVHDIGKPGEKGFGVGVCLEEYLPEGMFPMSGTEILGHNNYGNYQFKDGSICCYIPIHWMKIVGNVFFILNFSYFSSINQAFSKGYFLPRCFIDGGNIKPGYFVDKYLCSINNYGSGLIASSIKNSDPIVFDSNNPISNLTACNTNNLNEAITAAKARDGIDGNINTNSKWFCCSRFIAVNLAMLSMTHGQFTKNNIYCDWYDSKLISNYPKGCNEYTLTDYMDNEIQYLHTDYNYENFGKTGSGVPFAKTTHNGQNCGVADLNGLLGEIQIGFTSNGIDCYITKESTSMKTFTSGNTIITDHWGLIGINELMEKIEISYLDDSNDNYQKMGNNFNQVFSDETLTNLEESKIRSLGFPKDENGFSSIGTFLFGNDSIYIGNKFKSEKSIIIGGNHCLGRLDSGIWSYEIKLYDDNSKYIGFRLAQYPE